ncbi:MAG: vitamin K epoxide reductase family protein [Chitinophaga rupis]
MSTRSTIPLQLEFWQTAYEWLRQTGNTINKNYCKEELTTHPDYPSLVSLTDFLENGNLGYRAITADVSYLQEFNYPVLIHIRQHANQYMHILSSPADWEKQKDIVTHWSGVVLYAKKNAKWHNQHHTLYQRTEKKRKAISFTLVLISLLLFCITASFTNSLSITTMAFGLLSLAGIIISIAALGTELGFQNEITRQVCGLGTGSGCEKVLKSPFAKGIAGLTPADAAVLYFLSQFILYLFSPLNHSFIPGIFRISLAGLVMVGWSLYTQAFRLKEWCALCLAIVGILTGQALLSIIIVPTFSDFLPEGLFVSLFAFLALLLFPVKQLIITNTSNKTKLTELRKWKLDADLFVSEWEKEPETDTVIWENDLLLGNPFAPLLITVACNPYCTPCSKAHIKLDNLLQRFPDKLRLLVRLSCAPRDVTDQKTIAVKAILQKAFTLQNKKELQQLLTDWFEKMNYQQWEEKWQPDKNISVQERIQQHYDWMERSKIAFTPTFFINGKKLPGRYSIDDLEQLIPQLAELMTTETMEQMLIN